MPMNQLPPLMTLLSELIARPSVSCVCPEFDQSNQAVIEKLAEWCTVLGFKVEILPLAGHPNKFNLIATLGTGSGGLVLSGHTDTVPYDLNRWQHNPFQLYEKDSRLYGLGTSDMKSFFAVALTAVAKFDPKTLQRPLVLLATADEESSMCGAKALSRASFPHVRHAIIGEPTNLRPVRMHKGIFMEGIHLSGLAGHSSDPSLGRSALEGMHAVIGDLLNWRRELQEKYNNPAFAVPVPTLNLGHIHGGDNPNRICGECELHIDLRPLPSMNLNELKQTLHDRVQRIIEPLALKAEFISLFEGIPAVETAAEAEIVQIAERLTQHTSESVAFATEAPYLNDLGIETIVLGPGDIAQAHQPDEFLAIDRLTPSIELIAKFIHHFCVK